jgi:hypothetical protein
MGPFWALFIVRFIKLKFVIVISIMRLCRHKTISSVSTLRGRQYIPLAISSLLARQENRNAPRRLFVEHGKKGLFVFEKERN